MFLNCFCRPRSSQIPSSVANLICREGVGLQLSGGVHEVPRAEWGGNGRRREPEQYRLQAELGSHRCSVKGEGPTQGVRPFHVLSEDHFALRCKCSRRCDLVRLPRHHVRSLVACRDQSFACLPGIRLLCRFLGGEIALLRVQM